MRMKKKEMRQAIEDGTTVAVRAGWSEGDVPLHAVRARIVAVDQRRRVFSGARHDMGGHITEDGVRVALLQDALPGLSSSAPIVRTEGYGHNDIREDGTTDRIVAPQDVLAPWDEYVVALEEQEDAARARKARRAEQQTRAERAAEVLGGRAREWAPGSWDVVLDLEAAERLMEDAFDRAPALRQVGVVKGA